MKKIITLGLLIATVAFVASPVVAHAAITADEQVQINLSVNEIKADLVNFAATYQTYSLLLSKIALDVNVLRLQFEQGQMSTEQADVKLMNIRADVTSALAIKASVETQLSQIITKFNNLKLNLAIYRNS